MSANESRPTVSGTASRCLLAGDITSISPEAFAAHKRRREAAMRRIASRELNDICDAHEPERRPAPIPLEMAVAERADYLEALRHADDPEVAHRCGYGWFGVPVAWQEWELAERFGEVAA